MTTYAKTTPVAGPDSPPISGGIRANFTALAETQYQNWCLNNDFMNWPDGDTSAPAYWRLTGSPTIDRSVLGGTPGTRFFGKHAAELTAGGAEGVLEQRVVQSGSFDAFEWLKDTERTNACALGCYIWTSSASAVRVSVFDGVDETESGDNATTSAWEWLDLVHDFHSNATEWGLRIKADPSTVVYVSGPTLWLGPVAPERPQLPQVHPFRLGWTWASEVAAGDDALGHFPSPGVPGVVLGASLYAGTAPTGQALQVQFAKNGTADMFNTKPELAVSAKSGNQAVDGTTYANRCLDQNDRVHLDIDQVGSSEEGENLQVWLDGFYHARPGYGWLDYLEID